MKKFFTFTLASMLLTFSVSSCLDNNDSEINYFSYILGDWACIGINGSYFATDSIIFYKFSSDGSAQLGYGTSQSDGSGTWNNLSNLKFSVNGRLLSISNRTSTSDSTTQIIQELNMYYLNDWNMACDIVTYSIDGVSQIARQQLYFSRLTYSDYSKAIVGIWQTPSLTLASNTIYREFDDNGTFDYYLYNNSTETYTEKEVGVSNYNIYSNYIVLSYTDTNTSTETYKCWKILTPVSTSLINWANNSLNGNITYQQLTSTNSLP